MSFAIDRPPPKQQGKTICVTPPVSSLLKDEPQRAISIRFLGRLLAFDQVRSSLVPQREIRRKPPTRTGQPKIEKRTIEAFEKGKVPKTKRKISPEEFLKTKRIMVENGRPGEEHVLKAERTRLKRANRSDLAAQISWVSQESVAEGYDILSFEVTGEERFIEVKATAGKQNTFEMRDNEWQKACELGGQYHICRVISIRDNPSHTHIKNPRELELQGKVQKTGTGWRVTYRP